MARFKIYIENDNLVELDELKDNADDSYVNDATVTVTLQEPGGTEVSGQTWPATMSYVASSDGKYQGTLEDDVSLIAGQPYNAIINVTASDDRIAKWTVECIARERHETQ